MFEDVQTLPLMLVSGGICIFLIGLDLSTKAFRKALGERLSHLMYKLSHSKKLSFFFGISLSAISQSSTAASSFAVGLVDVGMLPLESAILVTMGASIGTTFVTLLISMDLIIWAPLLLVFSTIMAKLGKGNTMKTGLLLQGLSLLLTGMLILKIGIDPLVSEGYIKDFMVTASGNPLYLGMASFAFVSIIQSSPAVMAIAIALASAGILTLPSIVAVVLGSHVGSSSIVLLAGLGSRVNARRLAWSNFIFRIAGALIILPLSGYLTTFTSYLTPSMSTQVALIHIAVAGFNILVLAPFTSILARTVQFLFHPSADEAIGEPVFLNNSMQEFPIMGLNLLAKEMVRLGNLCEELFYIIMDRTQPQERIPPLREGTDRLLSSCIDFLSGIQPPGTDEYWKHEYSCISYSLAALKDMTKTISENMYFLLEEKENEILGAMDKEHEFIALINLLSRLITQSVGSFALGGKEMSKTAKKTWGKYLDKDKEIRRVLLGRNYSFRPGEELSLWEYLSVGNKIARASFELARGSLFESCADNVDPFEVQNSLHGNSETEKEEGQYDT